MKVVVLNILLLILGLPQEGSFFSSSYIGKHKEEIKKIMLENHRTLRLNSSNVNEKYNYLKYEDQINEITVLFFLSDSNTCKRIRLMSAYSNINYILDDLNNNYEEFTRNKWHYSSNENEFAVILEEGDWFFTVTVKNKAEEK